MMNVTTLAADGVTIIARTVDNGDGTGTRTTYHPDGTVDTVEQLSGLPIPEPPQPTAEERIAQLDLIYQEYALALESAQTLEEVRAAGAALRLALEGEGEI